VKWDYPKVKSFSTEKRQLKEWEKTFPIYTSNKGLATKI
jgi:hypothetical protein